MRGILIIALLLTGCASLKKERQVSVVADVRVDWIDPRISHFSTVSASHDVYRVVAGVVISPGPYKDQRRKFWAEEKTEPIKIGQIYTVRIVHEFSDAPADSELPRWQIQKEAEPSATAQRP